MKPRGFMLIEFLVAIIIFSLISSGLYTGFIQGLKAEKRIRESFSTYGPLRILYLHLDQDLRNMVKLKDCPFVGKKDEIQFPALLKGENLVLIHYFVKEHALVRTESELKTGLKKRDLKTKKLIMNLKSFDIQYPYQDRKENRMLESFWLDDPYQGLPRALKLDIVTDGGVFSKMVSIPQGRLGHLEHAK